MTGSKYKVPQCIASKPKTAWQQKTPHMKVNDCKAATQLRLTASQQTAHTHIKDNDCMAAKRAHIVNDCMTATQHIKANDCMAARRIHLKVNDCMAARHQDSTPESRQHDMYNGHVSEVIAMSRSTAT